MFEAFVLNPPRRRKARRSRGRGRRRNSWGNDAKGHARAARKGWRRRKHKASRRRGRRRNPGASYAINPRRRRRRSRRRNPGASYAINPRRRRRSRRRRNTSGAAYAINPRRRRRSRRRRNPGGGMSLAGGLPKVMNISLPGMLNKGIVGQIANGIVQGTIAGGVVFLGYVGAGYAVNMIEPKLPAALQGKFTRPVLYGAVAGILGTVVAMVAPKGKKGLWALLAASGAGVRSFGSLIKALMAPPADPASLQAKLYSTAVGLADYIQVGEEMYEAGMSGDGVSDYIQVGEDVYEAGLGQDENGEEAASEEEEVVVG